MRAVGLVVLWLVGMYSLPAEAKSRLAIVDHLVPRQLTHCRDFISYEAMGERLQELADADDQTEAFSIGTSVAGRELFALRLSADLETGDALPEIRIIGGIHGNECMAAQLVTDIAAWLTLSYGDDPFVTRLREGAEVVLVPLLNPDGYDGEWADRENGNGVDLNRNLHFAWIDRGAAGPYPFSEPETRALRNLSDDQGFTLGLSYHTVAAYVNSPWNYTPHHPDEALFEKMGAAYAGSSSYEVVFGWDWYNIEGDVNDWSLGVKGTFDWTIELRSDTDPEWAVHSAGLEGFLSFVFQGVGGRVTDRESGEPLPARIEVRPEGVPVFTDPVIGDYHRVLLAGRYDITAIAEGFLPETREGVSVAADEVTVIDFALEPLPEEAPRFGFSINGMTLPRTVGTNSFDAETYLNRTMVWDALGEPDGLVYSLSPGGSVTVDMGERTPVADGAGADLLIVGGGMAREDPVSVLVSDDQDGPFEPIADGAGTFEADIRGSGFDAIRFVRLVDEGDAPFNSDHPGYDLDAVVNLNGGPYRPDNFRDTGASPDPEGLADGGEPGIEEWRGKAWGCGCRAAGTPSADPLAWILTLMNWRWT